MRDTPERRTADGRTGKRRISRTITPHLGTPIAENDTIGFPLSPRQLDECVRAALQEDGAFSDVTTIACVVSDRRAHGTIIAQQAGVITGMPLAISAFRQLDHDCAIRVDVDDGERVTPGAVVMRISGLARALLSAERVALNFLQRLSGIATLTARYVDAVRGTRVQILDTRKTTPGLRHLEKYAVRAGGGISRRLDLTTVLIKVNHLSAIGGDVELAVRRTREFAPADALVEVQCSSPDQVEAVLAAGADMVLFDGMSPAQVRECVELVGGRATTEASGRITLDRVREFAEAGVDRISVGALTQAAASLDLALEFEAV